MASEGIPEPPVAQWHFRRATILTTPETCHRRWQRDTDDLSSLHTVFDVKGPVFGVPLATLWIASANAVAMKWQQLWSCRTLNHHGLRVKLTDTFGHREYLKLT